MPEMLKPASIHPPFGNYAHGLVLPGGGQTIITSGQLGICKNGAIPSSVSEQAELCFDAIEAILAEGNMALSDVVQLRAYVTQREHFPDYMAVRDKRLGGLCVASTLLIVTGFTKAEFLVEVEATAYKRSQG